MKAPGKVRVISGLWRGRPLPVPTQSSLRPTPDRVRETLFNWLGEGIRNSHCLDLFAGTGALGFESASRGASKVWMLERDPKICKNLINQCKVFGATQVEVIQADAITWIKGQNVAMDYIFLDPPFGEYQLEELLQGLETTSLLKPTTQLYFECAAQVGKLLEANYIGTFGAWRRIHFALAGRVSYNLYRRTELNDGLSA